MSWISVVKSELAQDFNIEHTDCTYANMCTREKLFNYFNFPMLNLLVTLYETLYFELV